MNVGLDIGYSATKAVTGNRRAYFPSVVGTPDQAHFSINSTTGLILTKPTHTQVGEGAVSQSRFLKRREDRRWVESEEWYTLFLASLTELTAGSVDLRIITGLPIAFYDDRARVRDRLLGQHKTQRQDRRAQTFTVTDTRVIPQPFGALLAATLDNRGAITDNALATGAVGILDIGGKTTNLLSVNRLSEIGRETASANTGAWDAVRGLRTWLDENCPDLELRDHQIIHAIITRQVRYFGKPIDLAGPVGDLLEPLADQIIAEATQLWNGAAGLDAILVSGGGALLLGPYIKRHFRHAQIVEEPVFANAIGFYRFAERMARG